MSFVNRCSSVHKPHRCYHSSTSVSTSYSPSKSSSSSNFDLSQGIASVGKGFAAMARKYERPEQEQKSEDNEKSFPITAVVVSGLMIIAAVWVYLNRDRVFGYIQSLFGKQDKDIDTDWQNYFFSDQCGKRYDGQV